MAIAFAISITTSVLATDINFSAQNNTTQLSNQAKQLYQNEQYTAASEVWQQAVVLYEKQGDILNQAMALSNLALTQQKLGDLTPAAKAITSSVKLLQTQSQSVIQQRILANTLDIKGSIERSRGQSKIAFETWQQAADIYRQLNHYDAIVNNQVNQAQALQDLGYYRRSSKILQSVQAQLIDQPNSASQVVTLLSLSNALRATGNLRQSQVTLLQAEKIANQLAVNSEAVLLALGNTVYALGGQGRKLPPTPEINLAASGCLAKNEFDNANIYYLQARDCYQQAALSSDLKIKTKAQLNLLNLLVQQPTLLEQTKRSTSNSLLPSLIADIKTNLVQLPVTRTTIDDRLNLAQSLICLQPNTIKLPSPLVQQCPPSSLKNFKVSWLEIEEEINLALKQAQKLEDKLVQASALGYMGAVYQQTGRLRAGQQLTEQALLIVNTATVPEIAYLWQWQLGRIYQLQHQPQKALPIYNATFTTLQSIRGNLVAINPAMQFALREQIEPIYRERAALLLQNNPSQTNLRQARNTIEALQLAELNNFFREACLDATPQQIEQIDPSAAVIYAIMLRDHLALILSQPGKPLKYHQNQVDPQLIEGTFEDLYANLSPFLAPANPLQPNQTFYNWLIRPFEDQLQQQQTKTLVFILDGVMRGIPVASLYDGKQYLIEKYQLALTPGLQLLTSRALAADSLQTVAAGLTQSRQGFDSLPNVATEVSEIATLVPTSVLLDQNFTRDRLQTQVTNQPYPIVHLATHGQFSSRVEETFLLTWEDRIKVQDLDQLLQDRDFTKKNTPIELLILSACQTATGDKQAALGLAGVAVRSGARSTLATLWSVQDNSTAKLMIEFYRALKIPGTTKAQALRQAQLRLLQDPQYQHPFYWSAFVLVGNWL
ncbi:MAG: CHAT domain-containing protein [Cyanobacteria bacterium P01_G01_bin.67]